MKRQISTTGAKPSTIAEEAVDQLQENEKLVAGKFHRFNPSHFNLVNENTKNSVYLTFFDIFKFQ